MSLPTGCRVRGEAALFFEFQSSEASFADDFIRGISNLFEKNQRLDMVRRASAACSKDYRSSLSLSFKSSGSGTKQLKCI